MKRRFEPILYLFILGLFLWGTLTNCAKIVNPTGGPKDTIPPVPVMAEPPNFSTNFQASNIEIYFKEFIQLNDV